MRTSTESTCGLVALNQTGFAVVRLRKLGRTREEILLESVLEEAAHKARDPEYVPKDVSTLLQLATPKLAISEVLFRVYENAYGAVGAVSFDHGSSLAIGLYLKATKTAKEIQREYHTASGTSRTVTTTETPSWYAFRSALFGMIAHVYVEPELLETFDNAADQARWKI